MTPPVKASATSAPERMVATLHTSAADRPPAPISRRRLERLAEVIDRHPVWKRND
jgi:hypothetical protein